MIKVSIIIPVYNVEEYLEECLESVKRQTYTSIEVLVVNDGSPDQSQKIIERYCHDDERFHGFIKENGGLSDARNYAIAHATGEYLFFLDSDDYLQKNAIEQFVQLADKGYDLIFAGYNEISVKKESPTPIINDDVLNEGGFSQNPEILNQLPHCAWNKLYKKTLFTDTGILYPKGLYYEDAATSPRIYLHAQKIAYIPMALINYRVDRPGNITTEVNRKVLHVIEDLEIVNQYFILNQAFDSYKKELETFNIRLIYDNLWKMKQVKDQKMIDEMFKGSFHLLNYYFPNWKKSDYFLKSGLKNKLMHFVMTHHRIYQSFLKLK